MVKQKKSGSAAEKDRKTNDDFNGSELSSRSDVEREQLGMAEVANSCSISISAPSFESSLGMKRTRSRPQTQQINALREPEALSENDHQVVDFESRPPDGTTCQTPATAHHIATRSATGRLMKRPIKEIAPTKSPPRKQVKVDDNGFETLPKRRQWELWGVEDKNLFFEALFEHGKDFDAIQSLMAQKHKKRGETDSTAKSKDQIRHFYYRTCHRIASFIDVPNTDDVNKQAFELHSLICYGELRRRKGCSKMDEKLGLKLKELITTGSTVIRVHGKKQRIKIPYCRAMKRLCNVEEARDDSKVKLPERVTVRLHPRTNAAWHHVQLLSQNPRLLVSIQPDQHLSTVFDFLSKKWRLECLQMKEILGEKVVDQLELRLHVPHDCTLTPIVIGRSNSQPKLDFSFGNFVGKGSGSPMLLTVSPPNKRVKTLVPRTEDLLPKMQSTAEVSKSSDPASITYSVAEERQNDIPQGESHPAVNILAAQTDDNGLSVTDTEEISLKTNCSTTVGSESVHQLSSGSNNNGIEGEEGVSFADERRDVAVVAEVCSDSVQPTSTTVMASSVPLVERLSHPIDRTLGEEVTIAELFLMTGQPKHLTLEYDWVRKSGVEQSSVMSGALHHLVKIATIEFSGFSPLLPPGCLRAKSPLLNSSVVKPDATTSGAKGLARSPRVRQNPGLSRTAGLSPSVLRMNKDSVGVGNAPDASLDQSANYPWSNMSTPVTLFDGTSLLSAVTLAPLYTFTPPLCSGSSVSTSVTLVTDSGTATVNGYLSKNLVDSADDGVFRVPVNLPPKLQIKNGGGGSKDRKIIDKKIIENLDIYSQKRPEPIMPRKSRSRSVRKPLVYQRTLLPKNQIQTSQIMTLTLVPGASSTQTGSFLPVGSSTSLSTQLQQTSMQQATFALPEGNNLKQNVIKMEPTELKSTGIRRIVPVRVPSDSLAVFPSVDNPVRSSSGSDAIKTTVANAAECLHDSSSLTTAITGVDVYLESQESQDDITVQQPVLATSLASSFAPSLNDSNLSVSLLDISLPEGAYPADPMFDMELMNSNSSFTGFLESNLNSVQTKPLSLAPALTSDDSLLSSIKNYQGVANSDDANCDNWINNEDISFSNLLPNFSSVKQDFGKPPTIQTSTINTFLNENSRDNSVIFGSVDSVFQSMLNENSLELNNKLNDYLKSQERQISDSVDSSKIPTLDALNHQAVHNS